MNKEIFHNLIGKDIYFKTVEQKDSNDIHLFASDKVANKFIGWSLMESLGETEAHVEKLIIRDLEETTLYASVCLEETNQVIGCVMIFDFNKAAKHCEIGYVLNREFWGKGFGTECIGLMLEYIHFELKYNKVYAKTMGENAGSRKALENNEFINEATLKDHEVIDGDYYDLLIYSKYLG